MRINKLMKKFIAILVIVCVLVSMVQLSVVKADDTVTRMIYTVQDSDGNSVSSLGTDGKIQVGRSIVLDVGVIWNEGDHLAVSCDNTIISATVSNDDSAVIKNKVTVKGLKIGTTTLTIYIQEEPDEKREIPVTVSEGIYISKILNKEEEQVTEIGANGSFKVGDKFEFRGIPSETHENGETDEVEISDTQIAEFGTGGMYDYIVAKKAGTTIMKCYVSSNPDKVLEIPVTVTDPTATTGDKATTDDDKTTGDKTTTDDDKTTTGDKTTTDDDKTTTGDKTTTDDDKTKSTKKLPKTGATSFIALIVIAGAISVFTWYKSREIKY